ncbi:MAG TPA: peptidylprolyl isomerase [Lacipirellulaceae bacterium]|nr:peptidylprolyl isomerase [Lacipirellulaceae bacterium]
MARHLFCALAVTLAMTSGAKAQIMRFETSVGSFDMELNPTNDPNLKGLVDNMVGYIGLGRYHYTAINRAADSFVLQMGSFLGFPPTPGDFLSLLQEIRRLDPVIVDSNGDGQVDFFAQSNTRGTVSLALSAAGPNSGTSSFFINLGDNSSLDAQGFVPFARIVDMATVDRIMELDKTNLTGNPNDLTFRDVPLMENGRMVILKSVRVLQAAPDFSFVGPVQAALERIQQEAEFEAPALAAAAVAVESAVNATPEPSSAALAALGLLVVLRRRRP